MTTAFGIGFLPSLTFPDMEEVVICAVSEKVVIKKQNASMMADKPAFNLMFSV